MKEKVHGRSLNLAEEVQHGGCVQRPAGGSARRGGPAQRAAVSGEEGWRDVQRGWADDGWGE